MQLEQVEAENQSESPVASRKPKRSSAREQWEDTGLVWTQTTGADMHPERVSRRFRFLSARAGLPAIWFHDYADLRVMPTSPRRCWSAGVGFLRLSA